MMDSPSTLEELKKASQHWKERIGQLQAQAESADADKKRAAFDLIEDMKRQQAIFEQYLRQVESEEGRAWDKRAAALNRMLNDIDGTYRKALSYFY